VKEISGNLVTMAEQGQFDVIIQGCNCFCKMGSGIAYQLAKRWPEVSLVDKRTISGDKEKLGTFTVARVKDIYNNSFSILNAYTQYGYNGRGVKEDVFEYEHFTKILRTVKTYYSGLRIGMPMIGAGLACGNWERIRMTIYKELVGEDVSIVQLP